jgi:hypothetical protein
MHAGALGAAGKRLVRKKFTEKQPATSPLDGTKALPKGVQMSSGPQERLSNPCRLDLSGLTT